jgi:hypothetical protein
MAVMLAIYSTLGPARLLVEALRERNLLRLSFALVVILIVAVIAARLVRRRSGRGEFGVALGVALVYMVAFLRMGSPEERTHLIEYGVVAALIHQALLERVRQGRRVPAPAAVAVVATALLGLLDEGIQAMLPSRVYDIRDVAFNAIAGAMVVVARLAMVPPERPGWRVWFLWTLAGFVGWGLGMEVSTLGVPGGLRSLRSTPTAVWAAYSGLAAGGTLVGVMQAFVIRRYVPGVGRWILASLGGVAVVGGAVFGLGAVDTGVGWIGGATLFGALYGLPQWRVLRARVPRAGWWVPASGLGWLVGIPLGEEFGWVALGSAYGMVTGATLVWLLRQEASAEPG